MTGATHTSQANEAYAYDATGNRTNTGYTTGTNNRLLSDGTYTYQYDAEGNRTRRTEIATGKYDALAWDHHNRLTSVKSYTAAGVLTKQVQYTYDVYDRRIGRQVDVDGNGTWDSTRRFVYDGEDIVLAYSGSTAGSLTNRYLVGPNTDEILADETVVAGATSAVTWSLADNLGSVRDLVQYAAGTDTTTVVNHLLYDTFGQIKGQSNSAWQPLFAFTGREWDADAGLYFYRARWYDSRVGRFLSEDPIGFAAGDVNLNRYVVNAPTMFVDPSGMASFSIDPIFQPSPVEQGIKEVVCGGLEAVGGGILVGIGLAAAPPSLGVSIGGVAVGGLAVADGLDRFVAGIELLVTGKNRETALTTVAKHFGGSTGEHILDQMRGQVECFGICGVLPGPKPGDPMGVNTSRVVNNNSGGTLGSWMRGMMDAGDAYGQNTLQFAPDTNKPYITFNKTHNGSQPVPKGVGPNGGRLQSHHGLQQEWATNNLRGYDPKLAPTVTIETGQGFPHTTLSNLQNLRRIARATAGRGKWSSTINEELVYIVQDFRQADFSDVVIRKILEQNYRMLDRLGVEYVKTAGF